MKTNTMFRIALLIALPLSISNTSFAQRQNNNGQTNEDHRTTRTSQRESNTRYEQAENNRSGQNNDYTYNQRKKDNYGQQKKQANHTNGHNRYEANKSDNYHDKDYRNNGHRDYHNNGHRDYNNHGDKHYGYNLHPKVYHHRLPGDRYNHYVFNNTNYYHCDGHFYRYHPSHGYIMVESPYLIVNILPHAFILRHYNGHQIAYHRGYYYVPVEYGWMMVPEPVAPQFSLNIHIGR